MNQIFRTAIGPETVSGKLPSIRVGKNYCSLFHITGIASTEPAPKVWISVNDVTLYWEGTFDTTNGVWVVEVGNSITATAGTFAYAITMVGSNESAPEYIAGQGIFTVYSNITTNDSELGEAGTSFVAVIADLTSRIETLEAGGGATLPTFNPDTAFDTELRAQVLAITNYLNGA